MRHQMKLRAREMGLGLPALSDLFVKERGLPSLFLWLVLWPVL